MFPSFERKRITVGDVTINVVSAGNGPPLLLLHGYPQTLAIWRKVAPRLAQSYTVVATDLRGYGDSSKPPGGGDHSNYSKRAMAADQVGVMQALGHERFHLVGHDRGARVAHRLAMDHPGRVRKLVLLDISPTLAMYSTSEKSSTSGCESGPLVASNSCIEFRKLSALAWSMRPDGAAIVDWVCWEIMSFIRKPRSRAKRKLGGLIASSSSGARY